MRSDPQAATQAYIDSLSAAELALSRSYTAGGHWIVLGGLVVSAIVTLLIVRSDILGKVAARIDERKWRRRTYAISAVFLIASALLSLPWTIYTDWWREKQYGRTSQPLGDFLMQNLTGLLLTAVLGALFLLGVYALIRKTGRLWWAWSGALVAGGAAFMMLVSPILIQPLFNDYKPIPKGEVRDAVLELAAQASVPQSRVFMFDGSRQSNNFTANVSGVGSSARIAISDVAMKQASLDEVKAVTGHEIGHYVLGHVWRQIAVLSLLSVALFFLLDRLYPWFARKFGTDAQLHDPRGVPVLLFGLALLLTLAQPLTNAVTRIGESEADAYSLETAGLPDALSAALLKTAEYRYPLAGPVEEALFYTHPTVQNRIRAAMEWKAANAAAAQ